MEFYKWVLSHLCNFYFALIAFCFSYFAPIKGIFSLMVVIILLDLFFGIIAARHRGEGISSRKLWRTVHKFLIANLVVALAYSIDTEVGLIDMHKTIAWFIIGFEFWSILENLAQISNLQIFVILKKIMTAKIKTVTDIDINDLKKKQYGNIKNINRGE